MNLGMMAISVGVIVSARDWPLKAALFPIILGASGFILAVGELLLSVFGAKEAVKKQAAVDFSPSEDIDKALAWRRTLLISLWIMLFSLLIFFLGFPMAIPLFIFFYLKIQGREGWGISLIMTASCWLFFYGLFVWLLHTPFEEGYLLTVLTKLTN